jgi:hypothetical protein
VRRAANVAHHGRLSNAETENMTRVDPGIDAADDPQRLIARERQAGERHVGGEPSVASDQLVGGNGHRDRAIGAMTRARSVARRCRLSLLLARITGRVELHGVAESDFRRLAG